MKITATALLSLLSINTLAMGSRPSEAPASYQHYQPTLKEYAVPGACPALPKGNVETLNHGETLQSAYDRMNGSGTIEIPWNTKTIQCDHLRIPAHKTTGPISIVGIPGPNGEIPAFRCRSERRDGDVPHAKVEGRFLTVAGAMNYAIALRYIEVDGYKTAVGIPSKGTTIIERNYLHHGMSNGLANSNNDTGTGGADIQICGNEIAHYGQGNTIHNSYFHASLGGTGDTGLDGNPSWNKLTYVNNLCHSSAYSHCLKSIANENIIIDNLFYNTKLTDPSFTPRAGSTLVDVAACAMNTIRGNYFYFEKQKAGSLGKQIIGVRNRKTKFRGCDKPLAWTYDIPPIKIDGPIHSETYWESIDGEIQFPTIIEGNIFQVGDKHGSKAKAITMFGTYPSHETTLGSPACWLPVPTNWTERSRVYASNNIYQGFTGSPYANETIAHNYHGKCPVYFDPYGGVMKTPPGPGPSPDMIEIGENEVIMQ